MMKLEPLQQEMLAGKHGPAAQKAMQILHALGHIYGAERMVPVASVQIAGVSYDNLGDAGLDFLAQMADGGGQARVLATLNPAGMDIEGWREMGIPAEFAASQARVLDAFARMGVVSTCTCTPYFAGNLPHFGEHIAWAESSAVCYANSVIGARTNREGGPSALAAALTGVTPCYGLHLEQNRAPALLVDVRASLRGTRDFGLLGIVLGKQLEALGTRPIPLLLGVPQATVEELKSFCASVATYGGCALFHMQGITPEASRFPLPTERICIEPDALAAAATTLDDETARIDFVTLGCPHLSLGELQRAARALQGRKIHKEVWLTTSRPVKQIADRMGYTQIIEASGARIAADTCCVVAPIRGRFTGMATDSAKACYYGYTKNRFLTRLLTFDEALEEALRCD